MRVLVRGRVCAYKQHNRQRFAGRFRRHANVSGCHLCITQTSCSCRKCGGRGVSCRSMFKTCLKKHNTAKPPPPKKKKTQHEPTAHQHATRPPETKSHLATVAVLCRVASIVPHKLATSSHLTLSPGSQRGLLLFCEDPECILLSHITSKSNLEGSLSSERRR